VLKLVTFSIGVTIVSSSWCFLVFAKFQCSFFIELLLIKNVYFV